MGSGVEWLDLQGRVGHRLPRLARKPALVGPLRNIRRHACDGHRSNSNNKGDARARLKKGQDAAISSTPSAVQCLGRLWRQSAINICSQLGKITINQLCEGYIPFCPSQMVLLIPRMEGV
jgi:hypothetical protein